MLSLYRTCGCDGHIREMKKSEEEGITVCCRRMAAILHLTEPNGRIKVVKKLMPGQLLSRKILGDQKMLQNRWRYN